MARVCAVDTAADRPVPQLVGFRRVALEAGAETVVEVELDLTPTRQRDPKTRTWSQRPGSWASIAPSTARELAARAQTAGAAARARPILAAMGKTIVHVGPAGAGQVVKVCNQVTVAVVIEAVWEALVLGAKACVDPARIADVLQGGLAATRVLEIRRDNFLTGDFTPGFRVRLHLKDLKNALELARENDVALPAAAQVDQLMRAMVATGRADYDHSGLITMLEDMAAFRVADAAKEGSVS